MDKSMKKLLFFCIFLLLLPGYSSAQNSAVRGRKAGASSGNPEATLRKLEKSSKRKAAKLVRKTWRSLGKDCDRADELLQVIGNAVDEVTGNIRNQKYRNQMAPAFGNKYIEGLVGALGKVINRCSRQCQKIGQACGEWSAEIFCAVSEVTGKTARFDRLVDRPNLICGEAYRMGCESSFVSTAKGRCAAYTEDSFFQQYYAANSGGCCSYDVKE